MQETLTTYFQAWVVRGGVCMIALVPLSVISLGLIIQGFISLRRSRVAPRAIVEAAKSVSNATDYAAFRQRLAGQTDALSQVALELLREAERGRPAGPEENPEPIQAAGDRLYHSLLPLSVAYTIAPLLGLLGTILGLKKCFIEFATAAQRDLSRLTVGIDEALITTVWGLCIAIPVYIFHSILDAVVYRYEMESLPRDAAEILAACAPFGRQKAAEPAAGAERRPPALKAPQPRESSGILLGD